MVVMAKNDMYRFTGKTTDGKIVVGGLYEFTSTYGYPLDEKQMEVIKEQNMW